MRGGALAELHGLYLPGEIDSEILDGELAQGAVLPQFLQGLVDLSAQGLRLRSLAERQDNDVGLLAIGRHLDVGGGVLRGVVDVSDLIVQCGVDAALEQQLKLDFET